MRRKYMIIVMLILVCLTGCESSEKEKMDLESVETIEEQADKAEEHIFVFVCGAVKQEGVYELPIGSRVYEAVRQAGGFSEDAAVTQVNQAEVLEDETRLYIPTISEMQNEQSNGDGKVNLNTAGKEELMTLPGVGEAKAELIMEYRKENGRFQTIEDIMNISGIKEGLFEMIKSNIKV